MPPSRLRLKRPKKKHPEFKADAVDSTGSSDSLSLYYRYPWICGLPVWTPGYPVKELVAFNDTFVTNLASNPQISALAVDGKFEPAVYISPGNSAMGFAPGDVSFTE